MKGIARRIAILVSSAGLAALGCSALIDLDEVNPEGAEQGGRAGAGRSGAGGDAGAGAMRSGAGGEGGDPEPCSPNPCENAGECTSDAGEAECACDEPFSGERCEINNARTCLDWRRLGAAEDGLYAVDPDADGDEPSFDAYCDMTSEGGGWTLVVSQSIENGFLEQWGTTAQNPDRPALDDLYVLDFTNRLPEPGEVRMRHEDSQTAFTHTILRDGYRPDAEWESQSGATGLRRRVAADGQWLIFSRGTINNVVPDFFCVNSGSQLTGFNCDGNLGQSDGQGLFTPWAADEFTDCPANNAVWKHMPGPAAGAANMPGGPSDGILCNPRGFISVWFREPVESCAELKALGVLKDGVYAVDPDGETGEESAFNAYCDMTTRSGGWTLVAINGLSGRPTTFYGNDYPRPGASFYSTIEAAARDVPLVRGTIPAGMDPIAQYSINAKTLYTVSAREFLAYVGGATADYVHGNLPAGCNFFDGAISCHEGELGFFDVYTSSDTLLTARAQACTTAHREPPFAMDGYDEFGLHILAGDDVREVLNCHAASDPIGANDNGRIYTTFNSSSVVSHWAGGVHEHWNEAGALNVPGYLMLR